MKRWLALAWTFGTCAQLHGAPAPFGMADVDARARQLAQAPYQDTGADISAALHELPQEKYQQITFRPEATVWRQENLPFALQFFHEGWRFDRAVKINEIAGDAPHPIAFQPRQFDFGASGVDPDAEHGLGFAGWRATFALNAPDRKDEVLSFLGASYFRALGKHQVYGLSARGLAVDTALLSGEEFPRFTEFWIERPKAGAKQLIAYALLDSPRVTGAYRFVLQPGTDTTIEVSARVYLRDTVQKLGVAPLTSMFYFGANQRAPHDDYRPEVHDSDGLSVQTGNGEWLWRPLVNPKRLLVTSFQTTNPRGFGLLQRNRAFARFEDLDVHYETHPSAWIEPLGAWGAGRVELVEIPSPDETNDNIVAYWLADQPPQPHRPLEIRYRIHWLSDAPHAPGWVLQTRRGTGYLRKPDDSIGFVLDYTGPMFAALSASEPPQAQVSLDGNGTVLAQEVRRNAGAGGWRLSVRFKRDDPAKPVELRAVLRSHDKESETWSYILPAE